MEQPDDGNCGRGAGHGPGRGGSDGNGSAGDGVPPCGSRGSDCLAGGRAHVSRAAGLSFRPGNAGFPPERGPASRVPVIRRRVTRRGSPRRPAAQRDSNNINNRTPRAFTPKNFVAQQQQQQQRRPNASSGFRVIVSLRTLRKTYGRPPQVHPTAYQTTPTHLPLRA